MQSALTGAVESDRARPGRFALPFVLILWIVAVTAQAGALAYLPPVTRYRAAAGLEPPPQSDPVVIAFVFLMTSLGVLIILRAASCRYGWLMLATGFSGAIESFTMTYSQYALMVVPDENLPLGSLAAWVQDLWMIPVVQLLLLLPVLFPDGKLPSPRWRAIFWPTLAAWSLLGLVLAFAQRPLANAFDGYTRPPRNPVGVIPPGSIRQYQIVFAVVATVTIVTAVASLVYRWRVAGGEVRQQIKWVLYAFLLLLLTQAALFMTGDMLRDWAGIDLGLGKVLEIFIRLSLLGLVAALGIAVLKYRLYDVDLVINRTLVYGALTVAVAGGYVLVVTALGAILPTGGTLLASLLATGFTAALFAPLRDWLQRGVNRLMFGERDDPYVVLSRLGRLLSSSAVPAATLYTIVETVATALHLPYAAIQLEQDGAYETKSEFGTVTGGEIALPLVYQNEVVGRLVVAPRLPGESLASRDRQLLEDIAHQAGAVAHAVRLTAALQRSRQRLVTAREEERRRLRRDLHDGLGPTLASHTLKLDTAMELIPDEPEAAIAQLQELYGQTQEIVADIRRLVHQLRPPALDDLGLVGAVQAHIRHSRRAGNGPRIAVEAPPGGLPPLPAAVELAAYRITMEAVTNVLRHARAERCEVRFELKNGLHDRALQIRVGDDGQGLPQALRHGVGMSSMQERAEELGGRVVIEATDGGGTRVYAELPLPEEGGA